MRISRVFALTFAVLALVATAPALAKPGKPYRTERRVRIACEHGLMIGKWPADCEEEFHKDAKWRAQWKSVIKKDLKPEVREAEAKSITTNHKHVIMMYAGLWVIMVAFLLLMYLRQSKLTAEIERLRAELRRAVDEDVDDD